jgi:F0F1-type ATP synthase assembly protein I
MDSVMFEKIICMENNKNSNAAWWQPGLMLFMRLSSWIVAPVIISLVVGKYLDTFFHSSPWFFLSCVAIAFIVSMIMIVKIGLKEIDKK